MTRASPFLGAWAIWLVGYALLLAADLLARRVLGLSAGLSQFQVLIPVMLLAGAASGFFLAAGARWALGSRLLLLLIQAPAAYLTAVTLATVYLCVIGVRCP